LVAFLSLEITENAVNWH